MSKIMLLTLLIAGIFTVGSLATNEAYASVEMFLKIDGIEGKSTTEGHEGEIEVESWQWGLTNKVKHRGGSVESGKITIQDLNFVMDFEKASPKLMQACADRKHISEVVLTLRKGNTDVDYLTVTLTDVIISSYQIGIDAQSDTFPTEELSLNFNKIKYEYIQQDKGGEPIDPISGSASKHGRN